MDSKSSISFHTNSRTHASFFIGILIVVKLCSSFAIFLLANFINTKLSHTIPWIASPRYVSSGPLLHLGPLVQTLTLIQLGSGLIFMVLLKILKLNTLPPLSLGKHIFARDSYWMQVAKHSSCLVLILWLRIGGLQLCGPFRTVFVGTYYNITLAGFFACVTFKSKSKWHWQGVVFFVIGILLEYIYDDSHLNHLNEPWHLFSNSFGLTLLLLSSFLKFGLEGSEFNKNLEKTSGGPIQLHSVSTFTSGLALLFIVLIDLMSSGDMIIFYVLPVVFIVIFGFVFDYFVDAILIRRMDNIIIARIGTTASFFSAFIFGLLVSRFGSASPPGLISLLAFGSIYIATFFLTTNESIAAYAFLDGELPVFIPPSQSGGPSSSAQLDLSGQNKNPHSLVLIA